MITKWLTFVVVICLCCSPALAVTEVMEYSSSGSARADLSHTTNPSTSGTSYKDLRLTFYNCEEWRGVKSIIYGFEPAIAGEYVLRDYSQKTSEVETTYEYGGVTISSGTIQCTTYRTDEDVYTGCVVAFYFDEPLDLGSASGTITIQCSYADLDFNFLSTKSLTYGGVTSNPDGCPLVLGSTGSPNIGYTVGVAYKDSYFHHVLTYDYADDNENCLDISINKYEFSSNVSIVSANGITVHMHTDDENIYLEQLWDMPYTVTVINPISVANDTPFWEFVIPETTTPETPDQTALVHSYVYDAVTGSLINGMTITTAYDGGGGGPCSWPGGVAHTTLDWSYDDAANLTASADGYETSAVHRYVGSSVDTSGIFLAAGDELTESYYLMPSGTPSNTTAWAQFSVTEQLSGEVYFHSSGASVTIGNTSLITDAMGTCSFELSSGTYDYIVKKTGFQTVSGSFSLGSSNQAISVALPKIASAPTPTGQAGIDYPYTDVDPRAQAEESIGIIFEFLPFWASLCVIVVTVSFLGWMSPKKGRR